MNLINTKVTVDQVGGQETMDYEEPAAVVVDPDDQWAIDMDVEPLVNVATFGWTEGKLH